MHGRGHETLEEVLDAVDQAAIVQGDASLAGKRQRQITVFQREGHDFAIDVAGDELHVGAVFAIDELDDAHDLVV